jgi:hypothetical protein
LAATTSGYLLSGPAVGLVRLVLRRRSDDDDQDGEDARPLPSHN